MASYEITSALNRLWLFALYRTSTYERFRKIFRQALYTGRCRQTIESDGLRDNTFKDEVFGLLTKTAVT